MIDHSPPFRPARIEDADVLAELVNYAGEGLPLHFWGMLAGQGETPWDVGRRRAERENGSFSYRNAAIVEHEGHCAGALIGYEIPDVPGPMPADMPTMAVPLQELENLATGTWYVNVLAVRPRFRNRGLGTRLMELAERTARALSKRGLSVIVSDANDGARRLYERCDYRERDSRPMVKEGWENEGRNWVLLVKDLDQAA